MTRWSHAHNVHVCKYIFKNPTSSGSKVTYLPGIMTSFVTETVSERGFALASLHQGHNYQCYPSTKVISKSSLDLAATPISLTSTRLKHIRCGSVWVEIYYYIQDLSKAGLQARGTLKQRLHIPQCPESLALEQGWSWYQMYLTMSFRFRISQIAWQGCCLCTWLQCA